MLAYEVHCRVILHTDQMAIRTTNLSYVDYLHTFELGNNDGTEELCTH